MQLKVNSRIGGVKESATLAINERAMALRRQGKEVFHFGFGQSPFPVHPLIVDSLVANSHRKAYLPTLGLPELRNNISSYYGKKSRGYAWQAENIIIGPGSKELLFDLFYLLEGVLLLPVPSWVSYYPQAQLVGKQVVPVGSDANYKITAADLNEAVSKASALGHDAEQLILLLNSPNNPSGSAYADKELQELADIARQHNIIIIADEIYAEVCYDSAIAPSIYKYIPENTIVTAGLSKSFSAGGYRLGFAALPPQIAEQLIDGFKAMISETFSCVSAPIQYAAVVAYSDNPEINAYVQQCNQIHRIISRHIQKLLMEKNIICPVAEGAFYLFPDFNQYKQQLLSRSIGDSATLCERILDEAGVALLPAQDFGFSSNYYACRLATVDYDGAQLMQAKKQGASDTELLALAPNITGGCVALGEWVAELT